MSNPAAPHKGVIWVYAEVHEVTKHGECAGNPTHKVERFALAVNGDDRAQCVAKLNDVLGGLKAQCQQ